MSFKSKLSSLFTVAVAVVAFATFASAQDSATTPKQDGVKQEKGQRSWSKRGGRGDGFRGMRGGMRGMHLRGLDLTDAQKEQIKAIHQSNRPDQALMEEMRTIRQARRDGTITESQKQRLQVIQEQNKLRSQGVHQQVLAILTADQRLKLEQKEAEMKLKREQRKLERQQKKAADTPTEN